MQGDVSTAGRKRAAVELIARDEAELRHTARRYSLCAEDAEDAYQRALEILLLKAPTDRPRDLIRWTKTVVKHEALAVRRNRERLLAGGPSAEGDDDPIARIADDRAGPGERLERREQIARSREALQALKPAEMRALTLLAAGYSYAEIGEITGFSQTKVNRCLAEGRERLRRLLARSEDGSRCVELRPLLSAYCDGETSEGDEVALREHLRACIACRATLRAYRATPAAIAALLPAPPVARSLWERLQDAVVGLHARLHRLGDVGATQAAAGGSRGAGMAALAKAAAICAGTVGGAAACVAVGVAPPPDIAPKHSAGATITRVSPGAFAGVAALTTQPPAGAKAEEQMPARASQPGPEQPAEEAAPEVSTEAIEYTPTPEPAAEPAPAPVAAAPPSASGGSAAGEFGP